MDSNRRKERILVMAAEGALNVTITLGDVQVAVALPMPPEVRDLGTDQLRALALRQARRALQVAQEELE